MPNPLLIGAGVAVGGAVAKGAMHVGAWLRRTSAQSLLEEAQKLVAAHEALLETERAAVRKDIEQRDNALVERFASVLSRYGEYLEKEEIILPPAFAERVKKIPLPRLPHLTRQSGREALGNIFSSAVTLSRSDRYRLTQTAQHPQLAMLVGVKFGADLFQEGYADFKAAGENHRAAQQFYKTCEERCKTVVDALNADKQRILDFYALIDSYKWLFTCVSFSADILHSQWAHMWDRNKLAVMRAYGIYTEARTFNRVTLEVL